jgi:hypothetical protein
MTTIIHAAGSRPVIASVEIDGRRYRLVGSLFEGSLMTALTGTLQALPAPAPFTRSVDATVVEEGASC